MTGGSIYLQRRTAAVLVTGSGLWQLAGLWLERFSDATLLAALSGVAYLLTALGLFGQSRFSLFIGIVLPAAMLFFHPGGDGAWSTPLILRNTADLLTVMLCLRVLWALRHEPSV